MEDAIALLGRPMEALLPTLANHDFVLVKKEEQERKRKEEKKGEKLEEKRGKGKEEGRRTAGSMSRFSTTRATS